VEKRKYRILTIDGGGIRGIIPGQVLSHVESLLGKRIGEYFDMIAGTSTGGILTCAFLLPGKGNPAVPKYSAEEVVNLYVQFGDKIFSYMFWHRIRSLWGLLDEKYPAGGLERTLDMYFGETMLSELLKPTLITAYDTENRRTVFFTQHDAVRDPGKDFKVKDITRATSAAPTYFESARVPSGPDNPDSMTLVDGGIFANNPAMCAYAEARTFFRKPSSGLQAEQVKDQTGERNMATAVDLEILSLGTGTSTKPYPYKKIKGWGKAQWVRPVIDIMMSGVAETVDYQLEQVFDSIDAAGQYLRIDAPLPPGVSVSMDNVKQENLVALKKFGDQLFSENEDNIKRFLNL